MAPTADDGVEPASAPDWGDRVLVALRKYFSEGGSLLEPAELIDAWLETDPDGTPVLLAVYDHPFSPRRIGLRRRLGEPSGLAGGDSPEEALAAEIAVFQISEPLGRYDDLLVEDDNGVWWWGNGYPDLSEHPHFHLQAGETRRVRCLLRGSFGPFPTDLTEGTLVLSDEAPVWTPTGSRAAKAILIDLTLDGVSTRPADHREPGLQPQTRGPQSRPVLMPGLIVVTCTSASGSVDVVVSPADVPIVEGVFWKMVR